MTNRLALAGLALALGLACPDHALAQAAHSAAAQKHEDGTKQPPGGPNGQVASVDPASGQLRQPTAEEVAALAATLRMLSRDDSTLQVQYGADGTMSIDLQGTYLNVATASLGDNGRVAYSCTPSLDALRAFLEGRAPAPARPVLEEK